MDETAPEGAVPPPDQKPLLDFPFTFHGGVWFKGPWEIIGNERTQRKNRKDGRGRVPGIHPTSWARCVQTDAQKKAEWDKYLADFVEPPRIPTPDALSYTHLTLPTKA